MNVEASASFKKFFLQTRHLFKDLEGEEWVVAVEEEQATSGGGELDRIVGEEGSVDGRIEEEGLEGSQEGGVCKERERKLGEEGTVEKEG